MNRGIFRREFQGGSGTPHIEKIMRYISLSRLHVMRTKNRKLAKKIEKEADYFNIKNENQKVGAILH